MSSATEEIVVSGLPNYQSVEEFSIEENANVKNDKAGELPVLIKDFIGYFHRSIAKKAVADIHSGYENSFNKITLKLFSESRWPGVEKIGPLVKNDEQFQLLYLELYYRHIFSKLQPTTDERVASWNNYNKLFDMFLNADTPIDLQLPEQWLWDMVDEYIYQFQNFHTAKLKNKKNSDFSDLLTNHTDVWSVTTLLTNLNRLVSKIGINAYTGEAQNPTDGNLFAESSTYSALGHFALVGLLRVHCLLGDFNLALQTLAPIDLSRKSKGIHTKVTACHIALYYYMGFSFMLLRRYSDAIRTFSSILLFISRIERHHTRSYQYEEILKKTEQMYALLAMNLALCPGNIDEHVQQLLNEKMGDKLYNLNQHDEKTFGELFTFACPKFISPTLQENEESKEFNYTAARQKELFLQEIKQQSVIPVIRSYLKLYSSIPLNKLAKFLQINESELRSNLLCVTHKQSSLVCNSNVASSGVYQLSSDISFRIEEDMVIINDVQPAQQIGKTLLELIEKFDALTAKLR